ncbi:divalent-cation tolerance protein CutA [Altererythrobacter sp. GH1-8]|uniref:divalent-cation tolerance protein CutA n=1 Tax=Altererythrobacter sp. GH1-8 TaxID=3349333 RepID=UPI00374D52F5
MSALIYCPFPDREAARAIASQLLDEKLIACANILSEVESLFEWNGERGSGTEVGVLFKTHADKLTGAVERIAELHPYDAPAVLGWKCEVAGTKTAEWLNRLV